MKSNSKSIENYEKSIDLKYSSDIVLILIMKYYEDEYYDKALEKIALFLKNKPGNNDAIYYRAMIHFDRGEKEAATADFQTISSDPKYSKLAKRDQEIFTTTNYFDSLYNEYSSVDSSYLAVANKLFKNFMKKYQDRLIEIKNQRKIKSSDYDKINEKIYEVTNKLDTLAQSTEVPPYLPLKDNNERFVDILILPDKIESDE